MDQFQEYQEFENSINIKDVLFVLENNVDHIHNKLHNHANHSNGIVESDLLDSVRREQTEHEELYHLFCQECATIVVCFTGQRLLEKLSLT